VRGERSCYQGVAVLGGNGDYLKRWKRRIKGRRKHGGGVTQMTTKTNTQWPSESAGHNVRSYRSFSGFQMLFLLVAGWGA